MPDSAFETRLAAMDRRLRELQQELTSDPVASADPGPAPQVRSLHSAPRVPAGEAEPDLLPALYARLLASFRELLAGYELLASPRSAAAKVSAGPFSGAPARADFERALSELPGVRSVALRGYEAGDRAVWDVRLG